ncbi:UNVERIFIED_CONTAM: hypothetical protein GTU68_013926 [Idotea baltica]|nr:hypothetical protein [Idotea baltica]
MSDFVHLHLHTQYSVLDGANKIKEVVGVAANLGHPAIAITDHGNMHGAVEFYSAAKAVGVKPIIGCEVYISAGSRLDRTPRSQGGPKTHHLTLLCESLEGYRNLSHLVTRGFTEGFYFKPRIDFELLQEFNKGLICLSGCMASQLAAHTQDNNIDSARELIENYRSIFGERYFLEVQPHIFREQQQHNEIVKDLAQSFSLPMVATNDVHYPTCDDHHAQEVLMCVSTGKLITDEDRIKHDESKLHFKTKDEMLQEMPGFDEAISLTSHIADRCNLEFDFKTYHMPQFEPENGDSVDDYFISESKSGLEKRFAEIAKLHGSRLDEEIQLIIKMGFPGYFLVVSDFILWAKNEEIPVGPGRGSAAGSLVAYALFITEIDPIRYKLLFERFLNPDRLSMPDIDVDFCIDGRDRVIEYVGEKYGRDKVAQIVTFGTLKAKAAIKDVGRALGMSYAETDRIAKLIPAPRQGFDYPIAEALKMEKQLRDYADGEGRELIELAQKLEGLTRHTSTHAAGLVIGNKPIVEHVPLMMDKDGQIVTQFAMNSVEKIGLVKFDFLGLKTLSVLHEAVRLIKETKGVELDLNFIPLDDKKTFRLISSGRTIGVFQLESSGITEMVSRLKPNTFEDLVAILALYRPGPLDAGMVDHYINRKHKREAVTFQHPMLKPILADTYGIILYQEQIMQIARDMAGYSLAGADMLRRAMGKKKPEEMAKQREIFMAGSKENKIETSVAKEVFDQMETFARYGFNRSHSVAYAMISYQTAYLKAHFPAQLMAALMSFEMGDTEKTLKNMNECRELKIPVLPPDINQGEVGFSVVKGKILFGLAAIKSVGKKAVERVIEDRSENGPFETLLDFCSRLDGVLSNKRSLEHFVKSGAFDWTKVARAELLERLDDVVKIAARVREAKNSPQIGLFDAANDGEPEDYKPINRKIRPEFPTSQRLRLEREALGFYLSGHPLERFRNDLSRLGATPILGLDRSRDGSQVTVAGVITLLKLKNTKKGDRYATFVLEDLVGTIEVIVWPDTYIKVHEILGSEEPILLKAKLDVSDERRTLIASELQSAVQLRNRSARQANISLDLENCTAQQIKQVKKIVLKHRGPCGLTMQLKKKEHSETLIRLPRELSVGASEDLCNELETVFGRPVTSFK